jgi:site-specific DNA-cytosine methylase
MRKPSEINILVGCEESQAVCIAFRERGFNAFSCDILDCSGNHPEWHLKMDIFEAITMRKWDALIGFPPCTHLANAGGCYFETKRKDGRQKEAIIFFMKLLAAPIDIIALENPVGILSSDWYIKYHFPELMTELVKVGMPRKPDQVIQPFYFGDNFRKYTCLWLKNLKPLVWAKQNDLFTISNFVEPSEPTTTMIRKGKYRTGTIRKIYWQEMLPKKDRAKIKSKTFPGIATAMAKQWGDYLLNN